MTRVTTLLGPQVTELYEQVVSRIEALRTQRREINDELKLAVAEEIELRKYMRLFDPSKIRTTTGAVQDDGHDE